MNIDVSGSIPAPIGQPQQGRKRPMSKQQQNADAIIAQQVQLTAITTALQQLLQQGQQQAIPQQVQANDPTGNLGQFVIDKLNQAQGLDVPAALTADIPQAVSILPQAIQPPQNIPAPAYSRDEQGVQRTAGTGNCPSCNQKYRKGVMVDLSKVFIRDKTTNQPVPMGTGEESIPNGLTKQWLRGHANTHFAILNLQGGQLTWRSGTEILTALEQKQGRGKEYSAPGFMCGEKYSMHPDMAWPNHVAPGRRESDDEVVIASLSRMVNHLQREGYQVARTNPASSSSVPLPF